MDENKSGIQIKIRYELNKEIKRYGWNQRMYCNEIE